ncbi:hypothetical protein Tco_0936137 [Tanacetum coccineum]
MRALYSSHIACFQLGSRRAWNGDLGIRDEVMGSGGGGGGVIVGVGVVYGDGVDSGVGGVVYGVVYGVVCGVVKAPISMMIANGSLDDATWELLEDLIKRFPTFDISSRGIFVSRFCPKCHPPLTIP